MSDHKPILSRLQIQSSNLVVVNVSLDDSPKFYLKHPNLDNIEMNKKFNKLIHLNLLNANFYNNHTIVNKQLQIDSMYDNLTTAISNAYNSCTEIVNVNSNKKVIFWFTNELKLLKTKMIRLRFYDNNGLNRNELRQLKKKFKKIIKRNIKLYQNNEYYKIDKLLKEKNSAQFFKKVKFLSNNNDTKIDLSEVEVMKHYESIFNEEVNVDILIKTDIMTRIKDIKIENYTGLQLSSSELKLALKQNNISKTIGNDGMNSYMLDNCNIYMKENIILPFFNQIFEFGIIPLNFNVSHIIPIIKDKKKPSNLLNNLRPISISNTFAQTFERLILLKIPEINNTHNNQFGYKKKTSCTHAIFAFKETIIKYLEENQICYAAQLDAIKAFDRIWREALYAKLISLGYDSNIIILLKCYYDKLASKIKLNNIFSSLFYLKRGLKQGGVLSGSLFNTYIDDLLKECCDSNLGARFNEIIMCIIGFCDDIGLLSPSPNDLQGLLFICEKYGKKWAIEFNIPKCKFIVFGSNKFNDTQFFLNNLPLTYTSCFHYLGVDLNFNLDMSSFFIEKFIAVRNSYFSLNSFGFKPCGINPFLQAFVYKSYCISRMLYCFEIFNLNKKTLNYLNLNQNMIIRYMTGLSKNSHISGVTKILKLFNIHDLYFYMKLIFVKNLKNNIICQNIFNYLLSAKYKNKKNTKSFIKDFKNVCLNISLDEKYVIENIKSIIKDFKISKQEYELDIENELIKTCLENNHDFEMITQLNYVTYAGP